MCSYDLLDRLQLLRVSRLRGNGTYLHHNEARVIKNGKNHYYYLARGRTLTRLSVLIRLLLPTFGKPTTPTVTFCDALGLYALRRRSNAGAVPDARFVRWCEPAERNGGIGVVWRRCLSHAWAFSRSTRSRTVEYQI